MFPSSVRRFLFAIVLAGWTPPIEVESADEASAGVSFTRDVRPLLSDNCFFCHGPDKQEAGLRLDVPVSLAAGEVVVPGDASASELVARIRSTDPDFRMPPPEANRELSHSEIGLIADWIDSGAGHARHWSFVPVPQQATLTAGLPTAIWGRNAIDSFIYRRMQEHGLEPQEPAKREAMLRRVTLDLSGLPPTLDEMDRFQKDDQAGAYARVVDRLLAAPQFGEHWARPWLDLARYADTYGYDNDREMHMWPWRDWLLRALNSNLPYDQFLREQLAGDLLAGAGREQRLATAFNRLHRQNAEGGVLPEEFMIEYVADRTQTFATAFLGLTVECARCHDHKFDPISQSDYYRFSAFFNHIDENGVYAEKTGATPTPNMFLYQPHEAERHQRLRRKVTRLEDALVTLIQNHVANGVGISPVTPDREIQRPEALVRVTFDKSETLPETVKRMVGVRGQAAVFSGDEGIAINEHHRFERTEPFSLSFWIRASDRPERRVICHNSKPNWEAASRGLEVLLDQGRLEVGLSHFWPGNAIRVRTQSHLTPGEWQPVAVTYDGSSRAQGVSIYLDGQRCEVEFVRDRLYASTVYPGDNPPPLIIGARLSEYGLLGDAVDEFARYGVELTPAEVRVVAGMAVEERAVLADHWLRRRDPELTALREELRIARGKENEFVNGLRSIMVMEDRPGLAAAKVLDRGVYDRPQASVHAGVPVSILEPSGGEAMNRLDLVDWLVRRDHPLTARVVVNRIWANFFGRGLVATLNDFGSQGAMPSHPKLLDFLSAWFMDNGWDTKALCRLIVTSSTYRQSAFGETDSQQRDPENRWLSRGPRERLSAEQIRDAALMTSGLLSMRFGGASVKPQQPAGLWAELGPQRYQVGVGEDLHRRSLYTFWKRTAPPPNMLSFDGVSREVCVASREHTMTPGQALILLNDPQFVDAARSLAKWALQLGQVDETASLRSMFRRVLSREPNSAEAEELRAALLEQRAWFAGAPEHAKRFCRGGANAGEREADFVGLASLISIAQLLYNHHEFQMK